MKAMEEDEMDLQTLNNSSDNYMTVLKDITKDIVRNDTRH